MSVRPSCKLL